MKTALLSFFIISFFNFAHAQHEHALTNAKIAHDASHRLGRLVDTGKINEVFIKNLDSLEVTPLTHTQHTDPSFKVTATAASAKSKTEIVFDMMGKYLSNKVISQSASENIPWDVNSAELLEAALHHVMETTNPNIDFMPFNMNFVKASLSQSKIDDGTIQGIVTLTSSSSAKVLKVVVSTSGQVINVSLEN